MAKKVCVIGSGFSGLAAAAVLAKKGFEVHVYEKNATLGGRARKFEENGFVFDMGPSWYWMPEIFENFYTLFGKTTTDFYSLKRLDPSYKVIFGADDVVDMPADYTSLKALFNSIEPGSGVKLDKFLTDAEFKYNAGMKTYVWKPGESIGEYLDLEVIQSVFKLNMLSSVSKEIRKYFTNSKLIKILEFPVLFLGATPQKTPALYSLMNYADIKLGTWYPLGGMHKIVEAFVSICKEQGVIFHTSSDVKKIKGNTIKVDDQDLSFDFIVASADYHHVEQNLLEKEERGYSDSYWQSRIMAPSSMLYYVGLNTRLPRNKVAHHNLFFDENFECHAHEIYHSHSWPTAPLFYMCISSITDDLVAPPEGENLFILIPISTELTNDNEEVREQYFNLVVNRLKSTLNIDISKNIVYKRAYCISDFKNDYYAYKGNAYGLANTLNQTAMLKPRLKSRKNKYLYYAGQLTLPGPGVPPAIISGQMVANLISKKF
jgi:phytoene desaturase